MQKLSAEDILQQGFIQLGIQDSGGQCLNTLKTYIKELQMFNAAFNLVKAETEQEIAAAHILDSLAAWKFFDAEINNFKNSGTGGEDNRFLIADAGSGAGFPGIPLASLFLTIQPDVKFILIERMSKRCAMLRNSAAILNLKNVDILETGIENISAGKYNIVTCRAFKPLDKEVLHNLTNLLKKNGKLFLYKATEEKITKEIELIKKENMSYEVRKLAVPFLNHTRNLLIVSGYVNS